jgi:hypothetical protein
MTASNLLVVYIFVIAGVLIILNMEASRVISGTIIYELGILSARAALPAVIISLVNRRVEEYRSKLIITGFVLFIPSLIINMFIQL